MMSAEHTIWWQVYPLGAVGAPIRPAEGTWAAHRLRRLEAWLDYAVELGCSGLLLGPIFQSSTHGYDTLDYFRLDERLGDEADWESFVRQTHQRGLSIMLDGVFNHVGVDSPLVTDPRGLVYKLGNCTQGWEGHTDLAEFDHDNPAVADLVVEVMTHWLSRGVDGWRLDVAYAVPAAFWGEVLGRVRADFPEAFFLGEVLHGDFSLIAADGTLDAVTAYELWKGIWSSLHDRNMWELAWALERHNEFAQKTVMQTFIGNHDVNRIAAVVGDAGAATAAAVLLTLPGMPSIYYGDEQAFRGLKGEGLYADYQLRSPLPENPSQLQPSGQWLYRIYQSLIGLRRRNSWLYRAEVQVIEKTNTTIHYRVSSGNDYLEVYLDVTAEPRFDIRTGTGDGMQWPR